MHTCELAHSDVPSSFMVIQQRGVGKDTRIFSVLPVNFLSLSFKTGVCKHSVCILERILCSLHKAKAAVIFHGSFLLLLLLNKQHGQVDCRICIQNKPRLPEVVLKLHAFFTSYLAIWSLYNKLAGRKLNKCGKSIEFHLETLTTYQLDGHFEDAIITN